MPLELSAQTPALSTTPHPLGRPGGPGLFRVKGLMLPAYVQNIAAAMERAGHPESQAIQLAIGACQRWARGAGKVSPEVRSAAAKALAEWTAAKARAHAHSNDQEAVELAGAFNAALHPRVAAGASNGGQFGSAAAGASKSAAKPKPAAKGAAKKPPAKPMAKPAANAAELAANRAKAAKLHAQAKADRAKAHGLLKQIAGINTQIKANQAAAAKAAAAAKTKAKKAGTVAGKAVAKKAPAKAAKKSATKKAAKKVTTAQLKAKRTTLRTKAANLMAQAKALDAQASHLKLANDTEGLDLATPMRTPRVRGTGDVQCKRDGSMVTVTHKPTGMRIGTLKPAQHGGWQGTHATGKPSPASGSMAGALSGLIGLHNKVAAAAPSAEPVGSVHAMAAHEAAMELAGAMPHTSAATSSDGPRVTTMGGAKTAKAAKAKTATVPERVQAVYRKLIAKGMKPAQAMALAKRAAAMHAKAKPAAKAA